jgi:tetratricopeptide (TPR) repeat protein
LRPRTGKSLFVKAGLIASLLGLSVALGETPQQREAEESQLEAGIKLLHAGRFSESVSAFNRFKQTAPQDPRPYFYAGTALAQAGQLNHAALELGEAVHLAPDRPEYRIFQAHVFLDLEQPSAALEALAMFQAGERVNQLTTAWLHLLAEDYYRLGKMEEALRWLDLWAQREPNEASIDLYRGQAYVVKGDADTALRYLQSSIRKSDKNPQAYFELGKILYQRNQLAEAKEALLKAVAQSNTNAEYLQKLGDACLAMGDPDQAIDYLHRAVATGAEFPETYYTLARAYRRQGDLARSDEYQKKFQEVAAAQREKEAQVRAADAPIAEAQRELERGNQPAARALFEKALQIDPQRWQPHAYLAEMLLSSEDWPEAYEHLLKMDEIDPDSVVGNYLLAKYWYRRKEFARARAYAEKVKWSRPDNSELRNLLGNIYLGLGQKEKAREEYQAAVRLAPNRADFREQLQKVLTASPAREGSGQRP